MEITLNTTDKKPCGFVVECRRMNEPFWLAASILYPDEETANKVAENMKKWSNEEYVETRSMPLYEQAAF